MLNKVIDRTIERMPGVDKAGLDISRSLHGVVMDGGQPARLVADLLHGKGLGHPLHSVLTDFAIGGWVLGALFDMIWLRKRSRAARQAAETAILFGTLAAIPTALSGLTDFTTIPARSAGTGLLHALLNVSTTTLYTLSLLLRRNRQREAGVNVAFAALSISGIAAMLGGHLAYSQRVGVNHDIPVEALPEWIPVSDYAGLGNRQGKRVDVQGHPILLYQEDETVYAISAVCSHDGGPLEKGTFANCTVECPWHQSVFSLRDGSVVHGPAPNAVTHYETRVRDGRIEVRLPEASK